MHLKPIWTLLCIICIDIHGSTALPNTLQNTADTFPAIFLHLSDIHVSTNKEKYFKKFGEREGDLHLFSKSLLPHIKPGALIITGDLTDSKDHCGAGIQQEIEWQGYRKILQNFTDLGGVPLAAILDHRGNHDGFNRIALRASDVDHFAQYSATGIRGDAGKRVWSHLLMPSSRLLTLEERKNAALQQQQQEGEKGRNNKKESIHLLCPLAVLLGIDFSEEPAFKNPLNFLGHSGPVLSNEIREEILKIKKEIAHLCPVNSSDLSSTNNHRVVDLPIISYGHYPLSSVHHHSRNKFKEYFLHAMGSVHSMQGVVQTLADVGTTSYLSGHLHTEFGERLHRAHPIGKDNNNKKKLLVELETGAWKDDRRFRIAAIDGGAMSFTDLYLHTTTSPVLTQKRRDGPQRAQQAWVDHFKKKGWGLTVAADGEEASVMDHVALLTWPVDARYSPQPAMKEESYYGRGTVRVLIFSFDAPAAPTVDKDEEESDKNKIENRKSSNLEVELIAYLPDGTTFLNYTLVMSSEQNAMMDSKQSPKLFTAAPVITVPCGSTTGVLEKGTECVPPAEFVDVQILVRSRKNLISTSSEDITLEVSQKWPVALSCSPLEKPDNGKTEKQPQQQECWLAPTIQKTAPMGLTWLEWIVLLVNWPVLVHRIFLLAWTSYVVFFLLLPRQLSKNKHLLQKLLNSALNNTHKNINLSSTRTSMSFILSILVSSITWPFKALVLCAIVRSAWLPMLFYSFYLIFCPLYFTYLHDDAESTIPAGVLSFGIFGKFAFDLYNEGNVQEQGSENAAAVKWQFLATPDTLPVASANLMFSVVPMTLWVACVVARHVVNAAEAQAMSFSAGGKSKREKVPSLFSSSQLISLFLIVCFNYMAIYRYLLVFMGPFVVLLSPGLAWMAPLGLLLATRAVKSQQFESELLAAGVVVGKLKKS